MTGDAAIEAGVIGCSTGSAGTCYYCRPTRRHRRSRRGVLL